MSNPRCAAYRALVAGILGLVFFAAHGAAAGAEEPLALPKFEVRDSRPTYYVTIPGYEILSLVGPKETAEFANQLRWQSWFLPLLLPPGRRVGPPVPATIILQSRSLARVKAAQIDELPTSSKFRVYETSSGGTVAQGYPPKWIRAWQTEEDTFTVFSEYIAGDAYAGAEVTKRAELQATMIWLAESRMLRVPRWYRDWAVKSLSRGYLTDVSTREATWTIQWKRFNAKPLGQFFAEIDRGMPGVESQVAAFVNWGFWADNGGRREAFLKFVDAAAKKPVREGLFREFFGIDFSTADPAFKEMGAGNYERTERLRSPNGKGLPDVRPAEVALATPGQVAAIMGAAYVAEGAAAAGRTAKPELLDRARQLLVAADKNGEGEPRVLAALGLLELASNNRDAAENYFEVAAAAKIVRPRVYLELARIRFAKASGKTSAWDDATVVAVLEPLLIAQSQLPEMQSTYELMVEIEARRQLPPPPAELDLLKENVWGDSRATRLVWKTALLLAKNNLTEEAARLIEATLGDTATVQLVNAGAAPSAFLLGSGATITRGTIGPHNPFYTTMPPGRSKLVELLQHLRANDGQWATMRFDELEGSERPLAGRP